MGKFVVVVQSPSHVWLITTPWTNCSMPGFPVPHHLLELAQTCVHWIHWYFFSALHTTSSGYISCWFVPIGWKTIEMAFISKIFLREYNCALVPLSSTSPYTFVSSTLLYSSVQSNQCSREMQATQWWSLLLSLGIHTSDAEKDAASRCSKRHNLRSEMEKRCLNQESILIIIVNHWIF